MSTQEDEPQGGAQQPRKGITYVFISREQMRQLYAEQAEQPWEVCQSERKHSN